MTKLSLLFDSTLLLIVTCRKFCGDILLCRNSGVTDLQVILFFYDIHKDDGKPLQIGAPGSVKSPAIVDYVDTWLAMEECVQQGLTRSIGVSNFNIHQLERVIDKGSIAPATNQVCPHSIKPSLYQRLTKFAIIL